MRCSALHLLQSLYSKLCGLINGRQGGQSAFPPLQDAKAAFERGYLENLLRATDGNISRAARIAGRHRTDLYKLMRKHSLAPQLFKNPEDRDEE